MPFDAGNPPAALQKALSYLGRFSRSEQQVRKYLARKEFAEPDISHAVSYLRDHGYLNDASYAESAVRDHIRRLDGPRKIRQSLQVKGIDRAIQDQVLRELYPSELQIETAAALLRKKMRKPDDRDRALRAAVARGFSYDIIRQALQSLQE